MRRERLSDMAEIWLKQSVTSMASLGLIRLVTHPTGKPFFEGLWSSAKD